MQATIRVHQSDTWNNKDRMQLDVEHRLEPAAMPPLTASVVVEADPAGELDTTFQVTQIGEVRGVIPSTILPVELHDAIGRFVDLKTSTPSLTTLEIALTYSN